MRLIRFLKKILRREIYVDIRTIDSGNQLNDKYVVVTGGASGIGAEITKCFLNQGATVLIIGRDEKKMKTFAEKVGNDRLLFMVWDITDMERIAEKFSVALNKLGRIDIWINNAGVYKDVNCLNCTKSDWDTLFNTNIKALYFATNELVKYFIKSNIEGTIINISSETGKVATTNPYAFTKNIVMQYTQGLAFELSKYKIRVNAIAPGGVATDIAGCTSEDSLNFPCLGGRLITAEEIAQLALYLASPISLCVNGQIIYANEGNTMIIPSKYLDTNLLKL